MDTNKFYKFIAFSARSYQALPVRGRLPAQRLPANMTQIAGSMTQFAENQA
jgi:hypothetical protein